MKHTIFGKSGLDVSRIAFGTWQLGGDWGPTDTHAATRAIRLAAERGVTFFDTAQAYGFGRSEQLLAAALRGLPRDQLVIATKGGSGPDERGRARRQPAVDSPGSRSQPPGVGHRLHRPLPGALARSRHPLRGDRRGAGQARRRRQDPPRRGLELRRPADGGVQRHPADRDGAAAVPPVPPGHRSRVAALHRRPRHRRPGVRPAGPRTAGRTPGSGTRFAPGDWRSKSPAFHGDTFLRNLRAVDRLRQLATGELGVTLAQLAVAWTLANPAVHVAIVGTRDPAHIDESPRRRRSRTRRAGHGAGRPRSWPTPSRWAAHRPRDVKGAPS